jgi:trigger factor
LNIQTEHLENQLARLTVTIEQERLDEAKQKAARKVANQIRIPGFRKGKVPYHILIKNGLEGEILNQAVENLSQDIYKEALLASSELEPYGPGTFEDFKLEEKPVFVYTVPLQPDVKLGDYRAVRREYTAPEVTDEMIDRSLKRLQEDEAVAEESTEPVALGNRVTVDLHSTFADDPKPLEEKAEATETEEDVEDSRPPKGAQFAHEHGTALTLTPENSPILPGFAEKLVGANVGDELDFELTVPEDDPEYTEIAGRTIQFNVHIEKVETVTLPELNDEFAQKVSKEDPEGELSTLDELKAKMRDSLEKQLTRQSKQAYVGLVIEDLAKTAEITFPEAMLDDHIEEMINSLTSRLQQQGIGLEMYLRVMNMSMDDLKAQYREPAVEDLKKMLVLREMVIQEKVTASPADVQAHIDEMLKPFGDNHEIRQLFDNESTRISVLNEVLQERVYDRIFDIATGNTVPDLTTIENPAELSTTDEDSESENS